MNGPFVLAAGAPEPLGAHWDGHGVNLSVVSRHAQSIEWCVFDETGERELARLPLPVRDGDIWHGYLEGAGPGLVYGLRVHGPYDPCRGHRFNPHKLLIDPCARALLGTFTWGDAVFGYAGGTPDVASAMDERDSAPFVPKCVVTAPLPPLSERPARPRTPWNDTVIYELHVKGFTQSHPAVPEAIRGTVAALAAPSVIAYLQQLGVTAIECMPMAAFIDERHLVRHGLTNYWGYNPIAPMAVHAPYLGGGDARAMADAVDRLHDAGIEVIIDIVLNHTAEGGADGPTLTLRGLDNAVYYRLQEQHPERYVDASGCGNTLDPSEAAVIALFHATLRYWACEIGVDGFRFDLATLLGRSETGAFDADAPLWRTIAADPDLRDLKLIAEPWDASTSGALGSFPPPIREWNGRYRDDIRRFWRGDACARGAMATRLAGSSDVFDHGGRGPLHGVNYVTCHDGFTLADVTSYAARHNEANPYDNHDGSPENWSSNGGEEGDTQDEALRLLRRRRRCAMLATLALSRGVPMVLAGDELSRTQHGNNNAFCQDNALSWLDWTAIEDPMRDLRPWLARALQLRRRFRFPRVDAFFRGATAIHVDDRDIRWSEPDGSELDSAGWADTAERALGVLVTGPGEGDAVNERIFLALNPGEHERTFRLPAPPGTEAWFVVLDADRPPTAAAVLGCGSEVSIPPTGMLVLSDSDPARPSLAATRVATP